MGNKLRKVRNEVTAETALILLFIVVSIYMFVESFSFEQRLGQFPRFTSGVVIICGFLILFRSYLPQPLNELVTDSETSTAEEAADAPKDTTSEETQNESRQIDIFHLTVPVTLYTAVLCILFVFFSILVGLLWIAPVFTFAYLLPLGYKKLKIIGLSGVTFLIGYIFVSFFNIGIHQGILT